MSTLTGATVSPWGTRQSWGCMHLEALPPSSNHSGGRGALAASSNTALLDERSTHSGGKCSKELGA